MDFLFAILPFFCAGLLASTVAKFSGINMSMLMTLIVLYMGATPVETVAIMLTFNTFSYFTIYSQQEQVSFKNFTFFSGFKIAIPMVISLVVIAFQPFVGITIFISIFLIEIFALIYKKIDVQLRPTNQELFKMCAIASVLATAGMVVVKFFPPQGYFVFCGLVVIAYTVLMWQTNDRNRFQDGWDKLLYGTTFLTGLSGIEGADWLESQHRNTRSTLSRVFPIVSNTAQLVALLLSYGVLRYFSMGALFMVVGAAVGIRFFGVTTYTGKGKFNYMTIGLAVLAVLIFFLVQPAPTGFPAMPEELDLGMGGIGMGD